VGIVNAVKTMKLWGQKESVVFQAAQDVVKKVKSFLMGSVSKGAQIMSHIFIAIDVITALWIHHYIEVILVKNVQQDLFFLAKILSIVFAPRISKNMVILVVALMIRLVYVKLILKMKDVDVHRAKKRYPMANAVQKEILSHPMTVQKPVVMIIIQKFVVNIMVKHGKMALVV
jgi:hypothetical protein